MDAQTDKSRFPTREGLAQARPNYNSLIVVNTCTVCTRTLQNTRRMQHIFGASQHAA